MKDHDEVIKAAGGILWRKGKEEQEIALIHRPKHDDWTLPKGKLNPTEGWQDAARREVLEETGYHGEVEDFAGSISYLCEKKPKVVLFWHMKANGHDPEAMNGEVDQVLWLTQKKALQLLDYQDEKNLLLEEIKIRKQVS